MNYTISNEKLTLVVSSKGGEFQSVKDAEGQEYLWQGDAATWTDRGPNLFPLSLIHISEPTRQAEISYAVFCLKKKKKKKQ